MTSTFLGENVLLDSDEAVELYHDHAARQPIVDFHCHLPPEDVARDRRFRNMTEVWLRADHYKWRAMRSNGVDERFCTGDAPDREKFQKWAETAPRLLRNPLHHWMHLELSRIFGVDEVLSPATAESIWRTCNAKLAEPEFSTRAVMRRMRVAVLCTTDDPADSLEHHRAAAADPDFEIGMHPTWRPDRALGVSAPEPFNAWVDALAEAAGRPVARLSDFLETLDARHAFFAETGCRAADHGIGRPVFSPCTESEAATVFAKVRSGRAPDGEETRKFQTFITLALCRMNHARGWAQQLHVGAMRNNNTRMFERLGPDAGFDSIGDPPLAEPLSRLLDALAREERLAPTILYNLNPRDNAVIASMLGDFQDGEKPGKMQMGAAWWFLDQLDGMRRQIEDLSAMGLLSRFVGMVTDSRSLLSYTRHEWFRRLLCSMLGEDMRRGLVPHDMELVGAMVRDICFNNATTYFGFQKRP